MDIGGFFSGIGSSIVSAGANLFGVNQQNQANAAQAAAAANFNAHEAMKNRRFQERMSNTAYQRAMDDMDAAGLNPMLAYSQGGASSPTGSTASMTPARMEEALGSSVASALEAKRLAKDLAQTDSNIALNNAYQGAQKAQEKLNEASAKVAEKNAKALDKQMPAIEAKARLDKSRADIDENMVLYDSIANRVHQGTGIISNATSVLRPKLQIGTGDIMGNRYRTGGPKRGDMLINKKGEIKKEF